MKPTRRFFLLATLGIAMAPLAGCGKDETQNVKVPRPYEGQYKNTKGEMVLEIKDGMMIYVDPRTREKVETSFTETDNKLMVESASGTFTATFKAPDTLEGVPAAIAKVAGPLKKS